MGLSPVTAPAGRWTDLPEDIAVAVASRLQEADVCALGCCSRSWRSACDADCVWERLFRCRWPDAAAEAAAPVSRVQGWKTLYINQHRRMAVAISNVVEFVGSSLHNGSLESENYLKAIADLASMTDIGFLDVQFFLFSRNHSAIINLIGLHYSIASLHVPVDGVKARGMLLAKGFYNVGMKTTLRYRVGDDVPRLRKATFDPVSCDYDFGPDGSIFPPRSQK